MTATPRTQPPDLSVVMSVYNSAATLSEALESVLSQTGVDLECIVIDDGSTDATGAMLDAAARRDPRLRVVHKANEGLTRALIDGCAQAKGRYIARIDAGDTMLPERLAKQKALLDVHPEAVLATCWTEFCGPEWEPLFMIRNAPIGDDRVTGDAWVAPFPVQGEASEERSMGPTSHPCVMMRADAYRAAGGYRPEFYYGQDWDLWYRLSEQGSFAGVQEVLYRCRVFPDGISMGNVKRQRRIHACSRGAYWSRQQGMDEAPFLKEANGLRPRSGTPSSFRCRLAGQGAGYYFIGEALRRNGDPRCVKYLSRAVRWNPFNPKPLFRLVQQMVKTA